MPVDHSAAFIDYRYEFRNGALIKTDLEGNEIGWGVLPQSALTRPQSDPHALTNKEDTNKKKTLSLSPLTHSANLDAIEAIGAGSGLPSPSQPSVLRLTAKDLEKRDQVAVAYSNTLLANGDTLVIIDYPDDADFNRDGLNTRNLPRSHRVHSSRLLATGSEKFKELLSPTKQFRTLRRLKLVNRLPDGVKYVLDLTPPNEGDEAVQLTADLSCSYGIRMWYTSCDRIGVSPGLVAGEDEMALARQITSFVVLTSDKEEKNPSVSNSSAVRSAPVVQPGKTPDAWSQFRSQEDKDIAEAINRSTKDASPKSLFPEDIRDEIPDYCAIRHRAGIVRLLNVIEGKNPYLDSAPKVWTLFVLAKHYECTSIIVDWVVQWMLADPNSRIVEILPEISCKIAFGMKNALLSRAAFAILVGEEALSLSARSCGHHLADDNNMNQFGRLREDVDEDLRTRIEYASKAFSGRIFNTIQNLIDPSMPWFDTLPEVWKVRSFREAIVVAKGQRNLPKADIWISMVDALVDYLNHYVRRLIMSCLCADLDPTETAKANNHRIAEAYKPHQAVYTFKDTYRNLDGEERIMTTFFWQILRNLNFSGHYYGNQQYSDINEGNKLATKNEVGLVSWYQLENIRDELNRSMLEAIEEGIFNGGHIPAEAYPKEARTNTVSDIIDDFHLAPQHHTKYYDTSSQQSTSASVHRNATDTWKEPGDAWTKNVYASEISSIPIRSKEQPSSRVSKPRIPLDHAINDQVPFFGLGEFVWQVQTHVRGVCGTMLDTSQIGVDIAVTDTLLCLGADEFKYLPLWAGGDDDDTGGVFDETIPVAIAGPNGPGPSYHTGFSDASAANSEFDFCGGTTSADTSLGVEDGFSDHMDRRRVISCEGSEIDTSSIVSSSYTMSQESASHDRKGKGRAIDPFDDRFATNSVASSTTMGDITLLSDGVSDNATEMGFTTDTDLVTDSDGADDVLSISDIAADEDAMWDEDDGEAFDFGDTSDDDMVMI